MPPVGLRHHVDAVLVVCRGHPGQSPVHGAPVRVGHVVVPGGGGERREEVRLLNIKSCPYQPSYRWRSYLRRSPVKWDSKQNILNMVTMSEEITQIIIGFPNGIEKCKNIKYVLILSYSRTGKTEDISFNSPFIDSTRKNDIIKRAKIERILSSIIIMNCIFYNFPRSWLCSCPCLGGGCGW